MNFSVILYLSSFKQFVHCSLVSGCDRYLLKKIFQSLYGSLLNHLFITQIKIFRSSLYLICITSVCFNYHFTRSKTVQFMEDLAVITAQNRQGSFGKYFVEFTKKKKLLFTSQGRDKLCTVFSAGTQDLGHTYFDV